VDRRAERVVAWSPPRVRIRGVLEKVKFAASRPEITCPQFRTSIITDLFYSSLPDVTYPAA
jgi:hypothetical protein